MASNKTTKPSKLQFLKADVETVEFPRHTRWRDVETLGRLKAEEEEKTRDFSRSFDTTPWEGAYALQQLLRRLYSAVPESGYFREVIVPSALGPQRVIWGQWHIPGLGMLIQGGQMGAEGSQYVLTVSARLLEEEKVELLYDRLAEEISKRELYSGVALVLPEADENGEIDMMTPPGVLPKPTTVPDDIILPLELGRRVNAEVFNVILHHEKFQKRGMGARGILCAGPPGTGKTLLCKAATKLGIEKGWPVFYSQDGKGLEAVLQIAKHHQPCIAIVEDIDRQLSGERTQKVDRILQALDGLGTASGVIFIATTNDASGFPEALARHGRFDSKFFFELPDEEAAEKLLRLHLGVHCPEDLEEVGVGCAGMQPASIAEVANKSAFYALDEEREFPTLDDIRLGAAAVSDETRILEAIRATHKETIPKLEVNLPDLVETLTRHIDASPYEGHLSSY